MKKMLKIENWLSAQKWHATAFPVTLSVPHDQLILS